MELYLANIDAKNSYKSIMAQLISSFLRNNYTFSYFTANQTNTDYANRLFCQMNVDRLMRYYGKGSYFYWQIEYFGYS